MHVCHPIAILAAAPFHIGCDKTSPPAAKTEHDDQSLEERFRAFKQRAMPKVGTRVTATGILQSGKLGWFLPFDGGEVYIYATKDSDISKSNDLNRFEGPVTVNGMLHHYDSPLAHTEAELDRAVPPEHFFFDVADITVAEPQNN